MQDLSGYKPESPNDGGFEAFKYSGPVTVEHAIVSENMAVDSEFYPMGCKQIDIEVKVAEGDYAGRKLWKRFNIDSETEDKKGKTPVKKLADQLFAVGLTFANETELEACCEKLVGMDIIVKAYPVDFKDGRDKVQMWNIKGKAGEADKKPGQTVAF